MKPRQECTIHQLTIDRALEQVAATRLPAKTDQRLQELMNRNNNGQLSEPERAELACLVEMSETLSVLRAKATRLLALKDDAADVVRQRAWQDLERLWQQSTFDSKRDRLTRDQLHERR